MRFNNYLARLLSGSIYNTVRRGGKEVLSRLPPMQELARRWEEHMKGMVLPGTLFEEFGFNYIGPIDGHDLGPLVKTLRNVSQLPGPQLLHVVTRKGHGYARAEEDPILYHGVTKFDPDVGIVPKPPGKPAYTQVFGDWLCDMAKRDARLIGITPAMREGSGMVRFSQEHADRYFDVGIAEQHAVTFAAGLACEGLKPVVAIYSTFLQRGYDQLIHDVALQNLPVMFAIDRGGIVGADGPTHAGSFDLTYLRCLPNMTVMAPADENECRQMLYTALPLDTPSAVRYPRGTGPGIAIEKEMRALPIGEGRTAARNEAAVAAHRAARVRQHAASGFAGGGANRRDRGEHALREADRRRAHRVARQDARQSGYGRGKRGRRRRRQCGRRSARGTWHRCAATASGLARCLYRTRATPDCCSRNAASTRRASRRRSSGASARKRSRATAMPSRSVAKPAA